MKKTALMLAALFTGAALSADEAPAPASSYSITADVPYVSRYVFRGVVIAHDSFQPSLKLTSGGAYAGIWNSTPSDAEVDNEIDFYGGYNFTLPNALTLDVGATYYWYPQAVSGGLGHSVEGYVGLNGSVSGVTVGGYVYRDFNLDTTTLQGSLSYTIPIDEKMSMTLGAVIGSAMPDDGGDYMYYSASVLVPYKVSDKTTVYVGCNWATNDIDGAEKDHFWVNAGFSYAF